MKLFKKIRKGFTLIELVVVIAVIAILSAVAVVSYISITNRAKESNDHMVIDQINTSLLSSQILEKKATVHEIVERFDEEEGYDVRTIKPELKNARFVYSYENGKFGYWKDNKVAYPADLAKIDFTGSNDLWFFEDEAIAEYKDSYSHYLKAAGTVTSITANGGLDVGKCTTISSINFTRTTNAAKPVVIRTNNYNTVLTVNAPSDVVKHYGKANKVDVIAVAGLSYHEHGDVLGNITLNNGRVVVENGSKANAVYIDATAEAITAGTVIVSADNSKEPEIPIILRDYVKEAADNKGGNNSIPNPETQNVIVLSDKVTVTIPETGEVKEVTAIAYNKTTKQHYASLADAVAEANSGNTIIMMNNDTTSEQIQINKSLTIDGNGYTLTNSNPNPRLLYITNFAAGLSNVEVTIKNINLYSSYTGKTTKDTAEPRGITTHTVSNSTINISNVKVEMAQNDYTFPVKMVKTTNCTININNSFLKGANCIEWINVNGSTLNIKDTTLYSNYNKEIPTHYGHGILVDDDCENNVVNCDNCLFMSDGNSVHYYAGKFNTVNGELVEYKEPVACDVTIMIGSVEWKHLETVADLVKTYINNGWDESNKIDLRLNADLFLSQNEYDIIVPASNINYNGFKIINN